ncbi:MAG: hypothetical protein RIB65_03505 [Ilumatobacter fluminis]|uniref:hypothetical protein n=1 Tax=Ilumatobacter fluminis TaxID=467091 RepID=UPI0032F07E33
MTEHEGFTPPSWIDLLEAEMEQRNEGFVIRLQEPRDEIEPNVDGAPRMAIGLIIETASGSVLTIEGRVTDQTGAFASIKMFNSIGQERAFEIVEDGFGISVSSY